MEKSTQVPHPENSPLEEGYLEDAHYVPPFGLNTSTVNSIFGIGTFVMAGIQTVIFLWADVCLNNTLSGGIILYITLGLILPMVFYPTYAKSIVTGPPE